MYIARVVTVNQSINECNGKNEKYVSGATVRSFETITRMSGWLEDWLEEGLSCEETGLLFSSTSPWLHGFGEML